METIPPSAIQKRITDQVEESIRVQRDFFKKESSRLAQVAEKMSTTIASGNKILICGNGGSAADSQHFAGEMVGRFLSERRALPAIALTTDTSILTAIGNDYGYEEVFSRQVEGLGRSGDLLFAISTSGNSPNVLRAVEAAKGLDIPIVALTGQDGGELGKLADIHLNVALGKNSPRIQETHIMIIHILVDLLDTYFHK